MMPTSRRPRRSACGPAIATPMPTGVLTIALKFDAGELNIASAKPTAASIRNRRFIVDVMGAASSLLRRSSVTKRRDSSRWRDNTNNTGAKTAAARKIIRHARTSNPARGRSHSTAPEPRPANSVKTEAVQAREPAGDSSAARMPIMMPNAVAKPREIVCEAPNTQMLGAKAVNTAKSVERVPAARSMRRRPTRSACATTASEMSAPPRVMLVTYPCVAVPSPNSFATNVMVCDNKVPK